MEGMCAHYTLEKKKSPALALDYLGEKGKILFSSKRPKTTSGPGNGR
jgi:hypothetical protein